MAIAVRPRGLFPADFFELTVIAAKNTPSLRAIRLPVKVSEFVPELIKKTTPIMITQIGKKCCQAKDLVLIQLSINSQTVAVYCIPRATGEDVRFTNYIIIFL